MSFIISSIVTINFIISILTIMNIDDFSFFVKFKRYYNPHLNKEQSAIEKLTINLNFVQKISGPIILNIYSGSIFKKLKNKL